MSAHLPECRRMDDLGCICPELRDCERRTLVAARDAVAAVHVWNEGQVAIRVEALAAIDALRATP